MGKASILRQRLAEHRSVQVGVGARDALEARLIERAGFDFVWASSLCIAASFGLPDHGLVGGLELVRRASEMDQAVDLPVVLDSDLGYSPPEFIAISVPRIERLGIAGICLEDKAGPKTNSLDSGANQELCDQAEFATKIRAAVQARVSDLLVIARIEAFVAGCGLHQVLDRARAYEQAGADCIVIHSRDTSSDEVLSAVRAWDGDVPLGLIPTTYPASEESLRVFGKVGLIIYANQLTRAGVRAQANALTRMRSAGGVHTIAEELVSIEELFALQRG